MSYVLKEGQTGSWISCSRRLFLSLYVALAVSERPSQNVDTLHKAVCKNIKWCVNLYVFFFTWNFWQVMIISEYFQNTYCVSCLIVKLQKIVGDDIKWETTLICSINI